MNLTNLTDKQLILNTKTLVAQESKLLVDILHHIKEIDRRKLHSDFKQPGLLELVMTELGYPRDQALRRIQAMRMMRAIPQVEEKLASGKLCLTTIGIVQTLFSHEKREGKPLTANQKLDVIEQVSGKSTRAAQKIVLGLSSSPIKLNERIKMIAPDLYEITAAVDEETVQLLEQLKGMLAHSDPNISMGALIKKLALVGKAEFARVKSVVSPRLNSKAEVRRQVWSRDQGKCSNCGSHFALEEDHSYPHALGGEYSTENIRLLCRSCNQRAAIKHFGPSHMEPHLFSGGGK